jgi:ParB family chromosome partitioning protein
MSAAPIKEIGKETAMTPEDDASTEATGRSSKKRGGLGRGLDALFENEEATFNEIAASAAAPANQENTVAPGPRKTLGIDQLQPGKYQPRQQIDQETIAELAESIAVHGVIQPLIVRPLSTGKYEIIAGERRWRASQIAQLHEVPVVIREMDDEQALEVALIENLQREDLNAMEEAIGYQRLMDEFRHTQDKLALSVGKSRSHVANMLRLLTLPQSIHVLVRQGKISAGHARALVTAEHPEIIAREIIEQGLSVRETERRMAESKQKPAGKKGAAKAEKDIDTIALEKDLRNALGVKVSIDGKMDGKGGAGGGTLKLSYKDLDELDMILKRLLRIPPQD